MRLRSPCVQRTVLPIWLFRYPSEVLPFGSSFPPLLPFSLFLFPYCFLRVVYITLIHCVYLTLLRRVLRGPWRPLFLVFFLVRLRLPNLMHSLFFALP